MNIEPQVSISDADLLHQLVPTAEKLLHHHMANRRVWYPDELIPYDQARSFKPDEKFDPEESGLSLGVQSALFVNLLTEDNLSYYYETIKRMLGGEEVFDEWGRVWNSEEGRHSIALRGIIIAKRLLGHRALEDARVAQTTDGKTPQPKTAKNALVYAKMQERATKISHRNTGKAAKNDNPDHADVSKVTGFMAGDEGMHEDLYGGLVEVGFELDPSGFVIAADDEITNFSMPGTGIIDFKAHSENIAKAGIFNIAILKEQIFDPLVIEWDIEHLENLTPTAEAARENLTKYLGRLTKTLAWSQDKKATKAFA